MQAKELTLWLRQIYLDRKNLQIMISASPFNKTLKTISIFIRQLMTKSDFETWKKYWRIKIISDQLQSPLVVCCSPLDLIKFINKRVKLFDLLIMGKAGMS